MSESPSPAYLHGFSPVEQARLMKQARLAESTIFSRIDYTGVRRVLEVGSGVGAQTEILLRRFPDIHVTCVDLNSLQLEAARRNLAQMPWCRERYELHQADATNLPFEPRTFDAAFLCWVLEHVPSPQRVLNEVRRVLAPGSPVYVTEVMNSSFLLHPYSPNVWRYWMAFNDFQYDNGGDPFVGAKLGNLLLAGLQQLLGRRQQQFLPERDHGLAPRDERCAERSERGVLLRVRAGQRHGLLTIRTAGPLHSRRSRDRGLRRRFFHDGAAQGARIGMPDAMPHRRQQRPQPAPAGYRRPPGLLHRRHRLPAAPLPSRDLETEVVVRLQSHPQVRQHQHAVVPYPRAHETAVEPLQALHGGNPAGFGQRLDVGGIAAEVHRTAIRGD